MKQDVKPFIIKSDLCI